MTPTSIVTVMTVVVVAVVAVIVMAVMAVVVMAIVAPMVTASVVSATMGSSQLFSGFWKAKERKCYIQMLLDELRSERLIPSAKTQTAQRRARRKTAFMILRWNNN